MSGNQLKIVWRAKMQENTIHEEKNQPIEIDPKMIQEMKLVD